MKQPDTIASLRADMEKLTAEFAQRVKDSDAEIHRLHILISQLAQDKPAPSTASLTEGCPPQPGFYGFVGQNTCGNMEVATFAADIAAGSLVLSVVRVGGTVTSSSAFVPGAHGQVAGAVSHKKKP